MLRFAKKESAVRSTFAVSYFCNCFSRLYSNSKKGKENCIFSATFSPGFGAKFTSAGFMFPFTLLVPNVFEMTR